MCTNGKCKAAFERPTPFLVAHNNYTAEVAAADAGQVTIGVGVAWMCLCCLGLD